MDNIPISNCKWIKFLEKLRKNKFFLKIIKISPIYYFPYISNMITPSANNYPSDDNIEDEHSEEEEKIDT